MEDNLEQMPLYRKGREILDLVRRIADLIDDDDKQLSWLKGFMLEDAYMLTAKIANAEGGDLYDIRMENDEIDDTDDNFNPDWMDDLLNDDDD